LFAGTRSSSVADTLIVFVILPVAVGVTTMVTVASKAEASEPMLHVTTPCDWVQLPAVVVTETKLTPMGSVSVNVTPVESFGPSFRRFAVYVRLIPTPM
jgi:hypothetical protein